MQALSIHRLSLAFQGLIFLLVKREEERKAEAAMKDFKYPTPEELYALEQWAHRERSKALARILLSAFSMVNGFFSKAFAPSAKTVQKHAAHHA